MLRKIDFYTAKSDEETSKNSTRMAYFQILPPDVLNLTDGSMSSNWRECKSAWSNYTLATKLDKDDEARQVATLLAVIGKEANKVLRTLVWSSEGNDKKIEVALEQFEDYCIPRQYVTYECFCLFRRDQVPTETIDQYMMERRRIASNCDWSRLHQIKFYEIGWLLELGM